MAVTLTTEYQKLGEVVIGSTEYGNAVLRLYGKYNSQSVEDNTTTVQYKLTHYIPFTYVTYYSSSQRFNGDISTSTTNSTNKKFTTGETTLLTATKTITHSAEGTKSINVGGSFTNSYWGKTVSINQVSATLPTIPRATTPALDDDTYELGKKITINTPRVKDTFIHKLYYQVGTSAKTLIDDNVETSYEWSDNLFLANWIPKDESIVTIYCQTYNGETFIGEKSVTFTGEVPSNITPEINTFTVEEYVEEVKTKIGKYVKGKSQLSINVSASGKYSSTIVSYSISANGETFTSPSAITSVLKSSGVQMVSVTVTDSRGRTSTKGVSIGVVDYFLPKASGLSVYRCDSNGTLKDDGVYAKAYINYEIAPIENLNDKKAMIQYLNGEEWVTVATFTDSYSAVSRNHVITNATFDIDNTYKFKLVVEDSFSSDDWNALPLPTSYTLMNYHQSGKAIGFGKVATRGEGFQFGDFIYDQFDTVITNGLAVYGGDPDTTIESLIMTSTNSPNGEAMYFFTFFSSNKTESQNCGQVAIPYYYNGTQAMYWRYRFGGDWGEWIKLNDPDIDSGWNYATLNSGFTGYSGQYPQYRRYGKVVEVCGAFYGSAGIIGDESENVIFTLPEGYRPSKPIRQVCMGKGLNEWTLTINTEGDVICSHHRNGTTYVNSYAGDQLSFNVTFLID